VPANFQSAGQEEAPAPRGWAGAGALISILCALHKTGEGCSIAAAMPAVLDQPFFATCPRCGDAMPLVRTMRSLWVLPEVRVSCAPRVARLRPGSSSASAGTRTSERHRALLTTRSAPERLTAPGGHLAAFTEVPVAASVGLGSLATVPLRPRWWTCELTSTRVAISQKETRR
jgi:hypothetical protein